VCSEKAFSHPYAQKLRRLQVRLILFQRALRWLHFVAEGVVAEGLAAVFQCQENESN